MKKQSSIKKNESNKKKIKTDNNKNSENKIIYLDSNDTEVIIGYDISKQSRYVQINKDS